ncbi:MAG: geranylgeranyl reductase family protein [Crenarchaeota archaeon]|nr:geranylgeranyl reductase family protein [Thermoproteota archaeon]
MDTLEKFDVIVAGLGPAGAPLLYHLAKRGFRVLGVDMRGWEDFWGKPCGDAIGAHHPREAGLPPLPGRVIKNVVHGIDIYSPGETTRYRIRGEGYIIDRRAMGEWLVKEAIARGAEVKLRSFILAPIIEGGRVVGIKVREGDTVKEYRASVVVEATGFSRVIRKKLPRGWPVAEDIEPTDTNIAYREIIAYEDYEVEEPDIIRIYIDQEIAPGGYWWYFPESKTKVNAGLGVQGGRGHPSPTSLYRKLVSRHPLFQKRFHVENAAGAPLPTRRPSDTMVGPGVIVIGDAGYTVNPLHGGGMGYAFRAAFFAANAFEEAYNAGRFDEAALWSLNKAYMNAIGARQAALDVFRIFLQSLPNEDIRYGMEKRLIPEQDVYYTSTEGEIKISILEKAGIILRGLGRPSLLSKLRIVAEYMKKVREHYRGYPDTPQGLEPWRARLRSLYSEYRAALASR